jgi:hypothetical protein
VERASPLLVSLTQLPLPHLPVRPPTQSSHPIAAVLGMSRNPTAYITPNASSVIGGLDINNSDSSGLASVSKVLPMTTAVMQPLTKASAMHIPHLFWNCLASGTNEFPLTFRTLIDHGSSAVLISEEYIMKLELRRRHLIEPYAVELAVEKNGQKVDIEFSNYIKVQLHDPSGYWTSRSVRAMIAPGLCAPMILGLPFLVRNNIVVDAAAHTVIDKTCGFDLLNPVAPPLKPPKQKLQDFFKELQEDCKLMVAELKMVCNDRLHHMSHSYYLFHNIRAITLRPLCISLGNDDNSVNHIGQHKQPCQSIWGSIEISVNHVGQHKQVCESIWASIEISVNHIGQHKWVCQLCRAA